MKNFSSDGSGKSLNVYNISSNRYISNGNLKYQCYEPCCYGKDFIIENVFSTIEGKAATILKCILVKTDFPKPFSEEHYVLLLLHYLTITNTELSMVGSEGKEVREQVKACRLIERGGR
ncbi:DUF4238 domain-containing protein [Vibrio sp. F74]|uniref:DUF4238 domain-containing protein n=1 Tax=Vibrio sp. F74 TaxID=700020 RepID=UPI0036F42B07